MYAVDVVDLIKEFGKIKAVDEASFTVQDGEIYGLIGPNGAGKTTILRIISTLLKPTHGDIEVYGKSVAKDPREVRKMISYLPEEAGAYENLTGREYLEFMARFFAYGQSQEEMVQKGTEIANLGDRLEDKIDSYSKGMTRRLLVGRALMMDPRLAILDELTSGLDVTNAQDVRSIVQDFVGKGSTVLLSSHNMFEVEFLCDRVGMINQGRIIETGAPSELKQKYKARNLEEVFTQVIE